MKKEVLKKYNIICKNKKELKKCFELLKELGFEDKVKNKDINFVRVFYDNSKINLCFGDTPYDAFKNINFYEFKKLYKKLIKDYELNDKGQVIEINNYRSDKLVYYINVFNEELYSCREIQSINKEFLDNSIKLGFVFDKQENCEKLIKFLKRRVE